MPTLTWTETDKINAIGVPVPYNVYDEIQSNVNLINTALGPACNTGNFAGVTGTAISFTAQATTDYIVVITPTANPGGNLGEVWVVNNSTTQATVYNSGSATTGFRFKVLP